MPAANEQERQDALPRGAALGGYTIEDVLGHGGFGIVYRARHNELGNRVAIKEYLPAELALREGAAVHPRSAACRAGYEDGLRRFRSEARALIEFQAHPSIVSCRDFFRANGTAYLVMEHEDGLPLSKLLRRREASGRPFDEADLLAVMVPLLEGLQRVHEAEMLHRDIKPGNILVRRSDERPVLIDFGAAKQAAAERSKSMAPYTEGYAALEQVGEGELGPWTDLYAVGAVMWRIVAGGNPPWDPPNPVKVEKRANAVVRGEADPMPSARKLGAGRFPPGVLAAIDRCLKLNEKERVRGCGELLGLLRGAGAAEQVKQKPVPERRETPTVTVPEATPQGRNEKKLLKMILIAAGVVLAAAAAWFALGSGDRFRAGEWFRDCDVCPEMVVIPAGNFLMGSPASEEGRDDNEGPQHRVTIPRAFAVGAYEVTVAEYREFVSAAGHDGGTDCAIFAVGDVKDDGSWRNPGFEQEDSEPVVCVSWEDAQAYVRWLSRKTGEEYRLLSEAEWEYAARAGTTTRYSFGDEITENDANYGFNIGKTQPVGSYRANGFGLHDMHGNVDEWVQDCWNNSYAGAPSSGQAWERGVCSDRVLRGGSWFGFDSFWFDSSEELRSANRSGGRPGYRSDNSGFRVARTLTPSGQPSPSPPLNLGERFRDCQECPEMVVIPAGSFTMGSPASEEGRDDNEGPQHQVTIPLAFAVGAYEVTVAEYREFVSATGHDGGTDCLIFVGDDVKGDGSWRNPGFEQTDSAPVVCVNWEDAQAYVRWLSRKTGREYRLLSEAEWEYAARAGTTTRYSFGDEITPSDANYDENIGKTQRVGSYRANGYGLYDMHGNALEWVRDCWNESYAGAPSNGDAWERGDCDRRVLRGGSGYGSSRYLRAAYRDWNRTGSRYLSSGFRVARTLTP